MTRFLEAVFDFIWGLRTRSFGPSKPACSVRSPATNLASRASLDQNLLRQSPSARVIVLACPSKIKHSLFALIVFGCALVVSGCLESDASDALVEDTERTLLLESYIDSLEQRTSELEEEARLKHEFLEEYVRLINKTLRDLEAITEREGMIHQIHLEIEANESRYTGRSIGQRIQDNLAAIEGFIEKSKQQREVLDRQRAQLNRIARSRSVNVSGFEGTIRKLNALIEEKEQIILALHREADVMLAHIDDLEQVNTVLVEENTELREAYYAVGTRDDLLERGIIDQRGGFLRIGRKTRIDQLDAGNFTAATVEIDMIFIGQDLKKMQILSNHRTNTALFDFETRDDGVYLIINNPEDFWKISRYLIVEVKK